jgi:hypothetical protein
LKHVQDRRTVKREDRTGAATALRLGFSRESFDLSETPLAQSAAKLLVECGAATPATGLYRAILRNTGLGAEWRATVLREAIKAAHSAGDKDQAGTWEQELGAISLP